MPIYLAGNWTDPELHPPGNIRAFKGFSEEHKWLEMHTGNHLGAFCEPEHMALQRKFLDYFLFHKKNNGMLDVPRVRLLQHQGTRRFYRENEVAFPPPDAEEVSLYLTPARQLSQSCPQGKHSANSVGLKRNCRFRKSVTQVPRRSR